MADIYSPSKRSEIMAKISGRETKPEIIVRKFLFANGFRYRKNDKKLPGKPDIVLPKYKAAIFVHGCFWHNHKNCKYAKLPTTRKEFWENKIGNNKARDERNKIALEEEGWKVITVWQCDINNAQKRESRLSELIEEIIITDAATNFITRAQSRLDDNDAAETAAMSVSQTAHLEEEFADYQRLYPHEDG